MIEKDSTGAASPPLSTIEGDQSPSSFTADITARQRHSGSVNRDDAVVIRCGSAEQVRAVVTNAQTRKSIISVHRNRRTEIGPSSLGKSLIIDLSEMRQVEIDPAAMAAKIEVGVSASDLIAESVPHGLVAVTGHYGSANMADLTFAGAYGPLSPRYGLALDDLLGVEIVLADGRLITSDAFNHPDLFWALRGGGDNFGVVTSMRFRMHPRSELLTAIILFPWPEAAMILRRYGEMIDALPIELSATAGIMSGYDGNPVPFLSAVWSGDASQGEKSIRDLCSLGSPSLVKIARVNYDELLRIHDPDILSGPRHTISMHRLQQLTPEIISMILEAGIKRTSPLAAVALYHFRGRPTRVPQGATAFCPRQQHLVCEIIAAWESDLGEGGPTHDAWAHQLALNLAIPSSSAILVDQLFFDDENWKQYISDENIERIRRVKGRYDPCSLFGSPFPPSL